MALGENKIAIYKKIDFYNRYENLSNSFQFEERLNYSNDEVLKLIDDFGYKAKYYRSEDFFKIEEQVQRFIFYFHICLKYSNVELIMGVKSEDTKKHILGSVFSRIAKEIEIAEGREREGNILKPKFRNYDDLKIVLNEAFLIYKDFKKEFLLLEV